MSDQQQPNQPSGNGHRSIREISDLFLSSVREKGGAGSAHGGANRPQRVPPGKSKPAPEPVAASDAHLGVDLTPEEFAQVIGGTDFSANVPSNSAAEPRESDASDPAAERMPPVQAMIVAHLNGRQTERVREYAAHLCKSGERVGVIFVDASEFTLSCFELGSRTSSAEASHTIDQLDGRRIAEAIEELNWDVDRWLIHIPNPRSNEGRALLRLIDHWTVLATCDHDGVVSCYRTLKGLADLHTVDIEGNGPTLSLSLLDANDEMIAMRVFRKLAGVCQQFLHWPLESEAPTHAVGSVVETIALQCSATRDKAQLASAPQWNIVGDFLSRCRTSAMRSEVVSHAQDARLVEPAAIETPAPIASSPAIRISPPEEPVRISTSTPVTTTDSNEVIECAADASPSAIVSATIRGGAELVELPVKPPMLADATLAVARDRRLVLLAVARQGLSDLRAIGEAYRWMNENRALIAMAVPQLSIDAHQLPSLRLLVDRADLSATILQPLLESANVTVQTYRKLRWGAKTGLLLEAA